MIFSVFMNDFSFVGEVELGEVFQLEVDVTHGVISAVAWSLDDAFTFSVMVGGLLEEQHGKVASMILQVPNDSRAFLTVSVRRRVLSETDRACAAALLCTLKYLVSNSESGATASDILSLALSSPSHELLRAAKMTSFIATFLSKDEEYFVTKRRNCQLKRASAPKVKRSLSVWTLMHCVRFGSSKWRQSTASFSTLMRFLQKWRLAFHWQTSEQSTMIKFSE